MKLPAIRKHRKKHKILGSLLLKNPVFVMGLDLPFIIAASVSLRNALAMSIMLIIIHAVTVPAGYFIRASLPFWQKMIMNAFVATAVMIWARQLVLYLFPGVSGTLGMYLYLIAINGMTLIQASTIKRREKFGQVISGAFLSAFGFTLAAVVIAVLREIGGAGTLMGAPLPLPFRLQALLLPFGGFMILAFLLAGAKFFNKKLLGLSLRESARKEDMRRRIRVVSEEIL